MSVPLSHPAKPQPPPSMCLVGSPVCQEWEESAAEAAAGRWADVPPCTARGHAAAPHAPHLAFFFCCVRSSTSAFAFTDAHLIRTDRLYGHRSGQWRPQWRLQMHRFTTAALWDKREGGVGGVTGQADWHQTPLVMTTTYVVWHKHKKGL